jgi:RNA recognition motif-containing protein
MFLKRVNIKKFFFNYSTKEPLEYRTLYLKDLPPDWEEDEIRVKLAQIGPVEKMHMVRNSLGEYTGKGKIY